MLIYPHCYRCATTCYYLSCVGNTNQQRQPWSLHLRNNTTEFNATATDNCPGRAVVSHLFTGATTGSGSSLAGVLLNKGATTITWTATDASGNTASCCFNVKSSTPRRRLLPVLLLATPTATLIIIYAHGYRPIQILMLRLQTIALDKQWLMF